MKQDNRVNVSRPDGRPEAYMLPKEARQTDKPWTCAMCVAENKVGIRYTAEEVVVASPIDSSDGQAHIVCLGHLPDDIVIYDPVTDMCRDKSGQNVWHEGSLKDTPQ